MPAKLWPWLLLVLAFLPALLIHQPEVSMQPVVSHVFTEAIFQNPGNLDPALASNAADEEVSANIFQTLVNVSPSGAIVPGLASSVTYHGNVVTIQLRRARLPGGQPLTPDMVARALVRPLIAPVDSTKARTLLSQVVGVRRFEQGKTKYLQGVQVTGTNTLQLTLKKAVGPGFIKNLANMALAIVPVSDQTQGGTNWQFTNLIGTGGYKLTGWTLDSSLSFKKVSGSGPQSVDLLRYPTLREALLAYQNHLVNAVPLQPGQLKQLNGTELSGVEALPLPGNVSLYINGAITKKIPKVSLSQWVRAAFRGTLAPLSARYPSTLHQVTGKRAALSVWVNSSDGEAMQLAQSLHAIDPHGITVSPTSAANLSRLARSGRIAAYLGTTNRFARGISVRVVPNVSFWLFSFRAPHAMVMDHQILSWHSVP
jgi:hypothetical protein